MSYSKKVQKAKASRSDHRKARAVAGSVNRTALKRDSKKFKSLEREHDQNQRFGGSLKAVYFDSDGDGFKDTYGRVYRSGVVGKPGAEIPTVGPIDPPLSGPTGLLASKILEKPSAGPNGLIARIVAPEEGPADLDATVNIPNSGPSTLDATVNSPVSGPTGLVASEGIPDAPVSGPTTLAASVNAPLNGPTGLGASVNAPSNGPTGLGASLSAPLNGPTGLIAVTDSPTAGPSELTAIIEVPTAGPSGVAAAKATLNIEIVPYDAFADDPNTGLIGEIKYASDFENLYIHNGTEWHRFPGGE